MKVNKVVKQETLYIAITGALLSLLMQGVFLVLKRWDITVLWGNLFGYGVMLLNFFLMALAVQKAVDLSPDDAKRAMKKSQGGRMLMMVAAMAIVCTVDWFHLWAGLLPLLFPRIAITFRMLGQKQNSALTSVENDTEEVKDEE